MDLECKVKKATSKSGNEYLYIGVKIGNYEKKVFLEESEKELLNILVQSRNPQK